MSGKKVKFAFQGAFGAFSQQAAKLFANEVVKWRSGMNVDDAEYVPCPTFGQVFESVESGDIEYGVIPLENSSIGSIVANYDLLWNHSGYIIAETIIPIHHHLIGFEGARVEDITDVYSHPAALDQCRKMFKEYPKMQARVHWDTSGAVAHVKESGNKAFAALAGDLAAKQYDMAIVKAEVEDFHHNSTRFGLFVQSSKSDHLPKLTSPYKMSCAAELEHKPGSLANLLWGLSQLGGNLTKIESRPIAETPWHYRFFMDIELDRESKDDRVISALAKNSQNHKVLGRYQKSLVPVSAAK